MTIITDYTLNAAAKTITLGAAYSDLKIEEILSIFDLTIGAGIYDYREPRKRRAPKNENGIDISLTNDENGCVISFIEEAIKSNDDKLQIIIGWNMIDGGTP